MRLTRLLSLAIAAGLCVAAAAAIVDIVSGPLQDVDWRLIATSFGFSLFSALGAAGSKAGRAGPAGYALGLWTAACAAAAFALLMVGLWHDGGVHLWQAFSIALVLSLGSSHASLMVGARRPEDSLLVLWITAVSVAAGTADALIGSAAIAQMIDASADLARALAVLIIVQLATSLLPSLLRRAGANRLPPIPA